MTDPAPIHPRHATGHAVYCDACRKAIATPGPPDRSEAVMYLRDAGWSNAPDRRWRCPRCKPDRQETT